MSLGSGHPVPATPPDRIESDPMSRRPTETLKASNPRCEAVLRGPAPRVAVRLKARGPRFETGTAHRRAWLYGAVCARLVPDGGVARPARGVGMGVSDTGSRCRLRTPTARLFAGQLPVRRRCGGPV
jgi:hypothetical protein